ncbi:GNAT family N-acetyltransferase [Erythrobacter sp. NFXS35]|uniref:GNAT family N-acetyltransferase n=1 Tax=Erythrobacter sp. NFXS35 TaxID=2818436 RepID=UPI0032DE9652
MTACPRLLDRIMAVMEAAFDPAYGEAWNRRQVADALAMPSTHALVVDGDGDLVSDGTGDVGTPAGFVLSRHVLDEEELLLIAVVPGARRRGIGAILINHLFDAARSRGITRIYLEMRRGNPALHLYRKLGFAAIGERPKYYRMTNGERIDAITFGRSI